MSAREFLRHNRWQKLFSLLLATLIWLTVRKGVERGGGPPVVPDGPSRKFEHLPVRILAPASLADRFRITPDEVTVVLRGRPESLDRLRIQDVEVYVNLSDLQTTNGLNRPVHVNAPASQVGLVSPAEVFVERLSPKENQNPTNP